MKIVKHINNNFAIAEDSLGNQCIVSGKGIGFGAVPREVSLDQIDRTYYEVSPVQVSMIAELPPEVINVSSMIVEYARLVVDAPFSGSIVFTLADHINFSIERYQKKMNLKLPIINDIECLFEKEMKVGQYGLRLIQKRLHVVLPKEEAAYIALHIINAEEQSKANKTINDDEIVEGVVKVIEKSYQMKINRTDFNYSRFVTHLHYLLKRGRKQALYETDNAKFIRSIKQDYPESFDCAEKVSEFLRKQTSLELTDEEKLYLMLHIQRLCTREACDR